MEPEDLDPLKELLTDTNIILLLVTLFVSVRIQEAGGGRGGVDFGGGLRGFACVQSVRDE